MLLVLQSIWTISQRNTSNPLNTVQKGWQPDLGCRQALAVDGGICTVLLQ